MVTRLIRWWTNVSAPERKQEIVLEVLTVLSEVLGKQGEIVLTVYIAGPKRAEINQELEAQGYNIHPVQASASPIIAIILLIIIFSIGMLFYFLTGPQ